MKFRRKIIEFCRKIIKLYRKDRIAYSWNEKSVEFHIKIIEFLGERLLNITNFKETNLFDCIFRIVF